MEKNMYWQKIRGICILSVVLIHALGGYAYSESFTIETLWFVLRQLINFAVPTFIFLSGYFVKPEKYYEKTTEGGYLRYRTERLLIPFVVWSLIYSMVSILPDILSGQPVDFVKIVCRFIVGKAATPFYYIIVLVQLTLLTPWLVRVLKPDSKDVNKQRNRLWLLSFFWLLGVYSYNIVTGKVPPLYETFFPAWFCFYYLGLSARVNVNRIPELFRKIGNLRFLAGTFFIGCMEAVLLRAIGCSSSFCSSQLRFGSFLYSIVIIAYFYNKSSVNQEGGLPFVRTILEKMGDCSYGIFYIHCLVLMIVGKVLVRFDVYSNWLVFWGSRFVLTAIISWFLIRIMQILINKLNWKSLLKWLGCQ